MPTPSLESIRHLIANGDAYGARVALASHNRDLEVDAAAHREAAALAEQVGAADLAQLALEAALRRQPDDAEALELLAELRTEAGDIQGACEALERRLALPRASLDQATRLITCCLELGATVRAKRALETARDAGLDVAELAASVRLDPDTTSDPPKANRVNAQPSSPGPSLVPTDEDLVRFLAYFGGREDVYARQWWARRKGRGGYSPVEEPLTPRIVRAHVLGEVTVGVYVIRLDQTARFAVVDIDVDPRTLERALTNPDRARALRDQLDTFTARAVEILDEVDMSALVERSGYKGRHLWLLFGKPHPAQTLHNFGALLKVVLDAECPEDLSVEVFPKQPNRDTRKGLGNLIKLPLGIHRRSGKRSCLHDTEGAICTRPFELLRRWERIGQKRLYRALNEVGRRANKTPGSARSKRRTRPSRSNGSQDMPPQPLAAAPQAPPEWTAADFDGDADVALLLNRCPVLASIRRRVDAHGRLTHDEQLVLTHTLGHLPTGMLAVNYLLARAENVPKTAYLRSKLNGHPTSCPKIRARVGHLASRVSCRCRFPFARDHYPTPLLHLRNRTAEVVKPRPPNEPTDAEGPDAETQARRYLQLRRRCADLHAQLERQAEAVRARLDALPDRIVALEEGRLRLVEREGVAELEWAPARQAPNGGEGDSADASPARDRTQAEGAEAAP